MRYLEVPGTEPPPPPAAFAKRMHEWAGKITVPVSFVVNEKDERVDLERAKALFNSLGGPEEVPAPARGRTRANRAKRPAAGRPNANARNET